MVDRVSQKPFSPLRTSSIGFIDDYESGMEASVSSMAEEEEEEEVPKKTLPSSILDYKKGKGTSHRRMSSGNSSTDSNATAPHVSAKRHHVIPRTEFTSPLQKNIQNSFTRFPKKEDLPTPSSGYDGDTEGPPVEDNIYK